MAILSLRFTSPLQTRSSPIKLNWLTILRFDEAWPNASSPLQLRFEGSEEPTEPVPQVLGIAVGISWAAVAAIEQQLTLSEHANKIDDRITNRWRGDTAQARDAVAWESKNAVQHNAIQLWSVKTAILRRSSVRWSLPDSHRIGTAQGWYTDPSRRDDTATTWHNRKAAEQRPVQPFILGSQQHIHHQLAWHGPAVRAGEHIKWGFPAPRWICTDAYQPPEPGLLTIRFDEAPPSSDGAIVIRFDSNPRVCHWDNGGGYIPSNPPLPPIDFKIPIQPQIRRLYLMQPVLTCHRVSDERELVIKSVSITDARSQFVSTANIEFSSKGDAILASNQLLRININGYDFYVISEQPSKREAWNSGSYSSSGRSKAAELLMPWRSAVSYSNSAARSFAGVLSDLLENTGWTVALQGITDFIIPAGVATISDKTPLESAAEFAGMVGCFLAPDDENNVINVLPRWPTVPWQMDSATPDVIIHDAVIIDYSSNETISQQCNAAWVRGEQQGVDAKVTLNGTAGNVPTDDIANALIVDIQAARIAGTSAIADTGNKQQIAVTMPIMADLPPLKKGQLIGVTWRGETYRALCDSIGITASVDDNGAVTVRQQATLLRPLE
ncbi:hypothetical protein [Shewanella sp.]|uniref:hypothetical protein n=1 Tax=Shewanella sp. TaxID=50422 RepID=UPI003D0BEC1B